MNFEQILFLVNYITQYCYLNFSNNKGELMKGVDNMENEIWKDIDGYKGLYQVSNLGRVKSLHHNKEKILKGSYTKEGYHLISLSKEGTQKRYLVHRLVATAFIPNLYKLECVNHKDENPRNNNVDNLEWCTKAYNNCYGTRLERLSKSLKGRKKKRSNRRYLDVKRAQDFVNKYYKEVCNEKI